MKKLFVIAALLLGLTANATVTFKVTPSGSPPTNADSFPAYAANAATLIKNTRTLPTGSRTGPTDARLLESITPEDLMRTASLSFYRGVFNPPAPFNQERGSTVTWWIDAETDTGTISLEDVLATCSSTPDNFLAQTVSHVGKFYTDGAIGIRADDTVVNSGPANQQVKRVIVGIVSKWFTVSSPTGVDEVKNYLNGFSGGWTASIAVTVKGVTASTAVSQALPKLSATVSATGSLVVTAEAQPGNTTIYDLRTSPNLTSWNKVGTIRAGEMFDLGVPSGPLFVKFERP